MSNEPSTVLERTAPPIVQELCELLRTEVGADAAAVTLVGAGGQALVAFAGPPDRAHEIDEIDLTDASRSAGAEGGTGASLAHPVLGPGGEVLGATVVIAAHDRPWTDHDRTITETLGRAINHVLLAGDTLPVASANDEIAMVAHDLRSPLTVLVGASRQLAASAAATDSREELAGMIARASAQLQALVDDLLATVQPTSRARTLSRVPIDLTALVHQLAQHCAAGHWVDVEVAADEPITVYADPGALERIVQNLLDNAVRHGEAPFRIALATTAEGATLEVSNHGVPIDAGTRARLFGRFAPGTGTTSGTGLGLHIVWRLVQALGGTVTLREEAGVTTFRVDLPQRRR